MANTKKRTTTKATPPEYPLLYVEWEDHSGAEGWSPLTETIAGNDDTYLCQSVGWLLAENSKRITIAASISPANLNKPRTDVGGQMTIAKSLITKRVTLRKP